MAVGDDRQSEIVHNDAATASAYMRDQLAPHRLRAGGGPFDARFRSIHIGSAVLLDIAYGTDVEIEAEAYKDLYFVHAATSGRGVAEAGSKSYEIRPANLLISDPEQQARVRWDRESRHRTLRIRRDVIEDRLRELLNKNLHDPITFEPNVSDDLPLTAMWRSTISYVYQQVVDFPELSSAAHMGRMYLNILVDMLLLNQEHNYSDDIRDLTGAVHPWHVRKAKQYIDQLIEAGSFDDEELRIEAIAEYTGISTRTLQASFARFVGDTPLKYIRHRKIERLHLALQSAPTSKRVTDVMTDLGINNFGRYSGYYKRRYGTSPSSTLRGRLLS